MRALRVWGPAAKVDKEQIAKRVESRPAGGCMKTPAKDTEDRVFRLLGLEGGRGGREGGGRGRVGVGPDAAAPTAAGRSSTAASSDAYATGSALVALHEAGGLKATRPRTARGWRTC